MSDLYRTFAPQLEVRTGANQDGRTIYGIAVPWNAPMRITDNLVEEFHRGAFAHQFGAAHRIKYAREHMQLGGTLIGRVSMMRDDAAGQYVELRVAKTPTGDETLELVREGALPHLSVGFRERPDGNLRQAGGVVARVKADMFEIASTLEGAYGDLASAAGVRSLGAGQPSYGPGSMLEAEEAQLRAAVEDVLLHGLPPLPDHTDRITAMRLGIL